MKKRSKTKGLLSQLDCDIILQPGFEHDQAGPVTSGRNLSRAVFRIGSGPPSCRTWQPVPNAHRRGYAVGYLSRMPRRPNATLEFFNFWQKHQAANIHHTTPPIHVNVNLPPIVTRPPPTPPQQTTMPICSLPLTALPTRTLNPAAPPHLAAPLHFRFILISDFLAHSLLTITSSPTLPSAPYAAVSYPWTGLPNPDPTPSFRVALNHPAVPSNPISIPVLRTACLAAREHGADLLWIDQLCILQTSAEDKAWQVRRMFSLYQRCAVSLVFPGGLQRLAAHDEHTNWIERAWTLQEAMPEETWVVFQWTRGSGEVTGLAGGRVEEVDRGTSAMMKLGGMLQVACVPGSARFAGDKVRFGVFGGERDAILALMAVKEAGGREGMREMAVWRSALMRTCSVACDLVFSVMGIFGVELEVERYGAGDREKAAADLVFEIAKMGGRASWLGAAPGCPVQSKVCSLPEFPVVDGREVWYFVDGTRKRPWDAMGRGLDWYVEPLEAAIKTMGCGTLHLTGDTLRVKLASIEESPCPASSSDRWAGFGFKAVMELDEGAERGRRVDDVYIACSLSEGEYLVLVVGRVQHYSLPAVSARVIPGAALLAILQWSRSIEAWEILTYGTTMLIEDVSTTWPRSILKIGR